MRAKPYQATADSDLDNMVIYGHFIVMTPVNIATLKARLSEFLRIVRGGGTVLILDRHSPVARIVPFETEATKLPSRKPGAPLGGFVIPGTRASRSSSLDVLLEQRKER